MFTTMEVGLLSLAGGANVRQLPVLPSSLSFLLLSSATWSGRNIKTIHRLVLALSAHTRCVVACRRHQPIRLPLRRHQQPCFLFRGGCSRVRGIRGSRPSWPLLS